MASNPLDFKLPGQFEYRGIVHNFPMQADITNIDMMDGWNVRPSDVLVATFPKSGTTWVNSIVQKILNKVPDPSLPPFMEIYMEMGVPGIPPGVVFGEKLASPRILKTHMRYEYYQNLVENKGLKVIAVMRDPRDCLASFYHFYLSKALGFEGDFHQFFELFKAERLAFGCPLKYMREWWVKKDLPNVLIITYEDLHKNASKEVEKIAEFLGKKLTAERVKEIVDETSFKTMKEVGSMAQAKLPDGTQAFPNFYRKGVTGDGKNHLNVEEEQIVRKKISEQLHSVGLNIY